MLDFNLPLKALDGTVIKDGEKDLTLGRLLSGQLATASKGDALKLFTWAQKTYAGEKLDLDPSDTETLKQFVKDSETMTVLAKAQILQIFK